MGKIPGLMVLIVSMSEGGGIAMPGAGQFMTGRPGEGALHLGAELLIAGGAWRGAHANLADGTVSFEPVIGLGSIGGGLRVRFH